MIHTTQRSRNDQLKQELQNDLQKFLADQASQNPRLKRLQSKHKDVDVSITDPNIGKSMWNSNNNLPALNQETTRLNPRNQVTKPPNASNHHTEIRFSSMNDNRNVNLEMGDNYIPLARNDNGMGVMYPQPRQPTWGKSDEIQEHTASHSIRHSYHPYAPPTRNDGRRPMNRNINAASFQQDVSAENHKLVAQTQYLKELDDQVRKKKEQQLREREKLQRDEEKLKAEMEGYDPWGKGGAGAPLRNADGTLVNNRTVAAITQPQIQNFPPPVQPQFNSVPMQNLGAGQIPYLANNTLFPAFSFPIPVNDTSFNPNPMQTNGFGFFAQSNQLNGTSFPQQSQSQSQPLSQLQQQAPNVTNHDKSFLRGVINVDAMSPWQKEEYNKKHRAQQETQDILRAQIAEKEAQRRKIEEQQKKEEQKEQERIMKEQEMLKQRYARELEEQRRKEEESRLENERLKLEKEKAQKLKEETLSQEKDSVIKPDPIPIQQNLHLQTKKLPATQKERSLSPPIPTIKANLKTFGPPSSPPIPTLRKKAASNKPRQSSVVEAPKEAEVNKTPRVEVDVRSKDMETQEKYNLLEQLNKIQKELELEQMKIKHEITNSSILPPSQTVLEPHRRPHQRRPQKQTNEPVPMDNSFSNWRQELINHQNDLMIENAKNRIANFEEIDSFPMKKNPDLVVKKESDGWARISEIKPLYETQIETIKQQELYLNNLRGKLDLNATTPANTQESRIIDEFIRRKTRSEKKFTSQREDTFLLEEFLNRPSRKVNSNPSTPLTLSSLRKQVSDDTRYSLISESKLVFINPTDEKRHNDLSTKSRRNIQPQNDDEQHLLPFLNQKNEYLEMMKQTEATETPVENKPATPESVDYIKQLSQLNEKRLKNLLELESSQTTKKKTYTEEKSSMLYADLPDFTQSSEKIEELIRLKRNNRKSMKKADSEIYAQDSSLLSMNFGPAGLNLQPDSV